MVAAPFQNVKVWTEVVAFSSTLKQKSYELHQVFQDSMMDYMESGKLTYASAVGLSLTAKAHD